MQRARANLADENLTARRRQFRRRNQTAFMMEALLFSFATTMSSQQTVIPAYVAELSDSALVISLVSVIYYGCTYCAGVFSCLIGLNTRSPKRATILTCAMQRVGLLFLFISTFFAVGRPGAALAVFFGAYAFTCLMSGLSSPLFNMLVANTIPDRIGSFFGSYNLCGALSGIAASFALTAFYERFRFPQDYRVIFLSAVVFAVAASTVLGLRIRETPAPAPEQPVRPRQLPGQFRQVWRQSPAFRRFVRVRMMMAAAEFSIPFFIVKVGMFSGVPAGYVGTASLVLLLTRTVAAKLYGFVSDRLGTMAVLTAACLCGVAASVLCLCTDGYVWLFPIFILVSFVQTGVQVSESVAVVTSSDRRNTTVYTALNGLFVTPVYILASLAGGALAESSFLELVFVLSAAVFGLTALAALVTARKERAAHTI